MPVDLSELWNVFELVSMSGGDGYDAFVCRRTGQIHVRSEDENPSWMEDVPEDLDDETKYVPVPDRHSFDLGTPLVFAFVKAELPEHYREVSDIFSRKGAYRHFKDFLVRIGKLDAWGKFEENAEMEALRDWCKENGLEIP